MDETEGPVLERIDTTEREVDCILAPEDIAQLGRELVNILGDIEEEMAEQTAEKARMKERITSLESRQSKIVGAIRRGYERRTVDVAVFADWSTHTAILRRTDTGEEIERRAMFEHEKQLTLTPDTAAAAEAAAVEHGSL